MEERLVRYCRISRGYCLRVGLDCGAVCYVEIWAAQRILKDCLTSSFDQDWHVIGVDCGADSRLHRRGKVFNLYNVDNIVDGIGSVRNRGVFAP